MIKRICVVLSLIILALCLVACTNEPANGKKVGVTNNEQLSKAGYTLGTPITIDDVVFTITECLINPVKGDRTEDNYSDDNGEYFAIGSDIVKVDNYEQIELSVVIENKSNKAITFSEVGWEAKLPDGYKLTNITVEGKIGEQMPSNYKGEGKLIIIKEKVIKVNKLHLTYNFMDYNEEWQSAIWGAISGEVTENEYKEKFNPKPVDFEITIK